MDNFTPVSSFLGGVCIGISVWIMWVVKRRIAGMSGITEGFLLGDGATSRWCGPFLLGLILGAGAYRYFVDPSVDITFTVTWPWIILGGFLVGFGSRLGGGCTSGHGVCGIGRLSYRSLLATGLFMIWGAVTLYIMRYSF